MAFVVLAMMLGVILNLSSLALDGTSHASDRQIALMLAQSRMAHALADSELVPGRRSGDFENERFGWELEVRPFEFPEERNEPQLENVGPVPYEVELIVQWEPNNHLTLNTLRLVRER